MDKSVSYVVEIISFGCLIKKNFYFNTFCLDTKGDKKSRLWMLRCTWLQSIHGAYGSRSASSIHLVIRNWTFLPYALLLVAAVSSKAVQPPTGLWACTINTICATVESHVQTIPKYRNGLMRWALRKIGGGMDRKRSEEVKWNERLHFIAGGANFLAKIMQPWFLLNFWSKQKLIILFILFTSL